MKEINNGLLNKNDVDKYLTLYGWVNKVRNIGSLVFVLLRDRSGICQVVFNKDTYSGNFDEVLGLKNEYCIKVSGKLNLRTSDMINHEMSTGEVELIADNLEILSESEVLPFNIFEENETSENTLLKYRYLALRRERLKNNIILRHNIITAAREYLNGLNFLEIETPILCKSTPEGARDYLVPSRINKGSFYALPQSPQIFKQILMVAGFEKYYQIARSFRDEDLRSDRQPEFTQIDLEMSFANEEDVWQVCEGMIKHIVKKVKNIALPDFPRITYQEAMERFGSEKPDTRFGMELNDITDILQNTGFKVIDDVVKNNGVVKCIVVKNNASNYSRKDIDNLTFYAKHYGASGLMWLKLENGEFKGSVVKNLTNYLDKIKDRLSLDNNDLILIVAGKAKTTYASLGALRVKIAKELNIIPENKLNFLWITDFPFFEYSETEGRWKAEHNPFTAVKDWDTLDDPENCLSRSYDLVVNGYELASGGVRNHNSKNLARVFKSLGISDEEAKLRFGFILDAFKYGVPPHAGIAPGVERLVMVLAGTDDIKDVIAFPKTQSASDLMSDAPSEVSIKQLSELGLKVEVSDNE